RIHAAQQLPAGDQRAFGHECVRKEADLRNSRRIKIDDVQLAQASTCVHSFYMPPEPVPPTRRLRKRQRTADHVVNVAYALFEELGYEAVTMEQIASAADVAKGTLYNHFPVKEALIAYRMQTDLATRLPTLLAGLSALPTCQQRLRTFLYATGDYALEMRNYLPHYIRHRLSLPVGSTPPEGGSGLDRIYAEMLAEGQRGGEITTRHTAQQLAAALHFLHLSTLLRWLATPGLELQDALDDMLDLFFNGWAL
ncbi:MAG: TetR/AcrR family transcriptional regulator, partial [Caldilineaceae bacterium]|nr:TetR/AcrR family transcriptional regulator [Caldilineaceae bacterium]